MKTKYVVLTLLGAATLVGFGIAASKINKGTTSQGGNDYRAQYIPDRSGGYSAIIFVNGVEQEAVVGPMPTTDELDAQVAAYYAGLDVVAFYTVHSDAQGSYYFDGWSRGEKITTDGPYASEQLAIAAGSEWARKAAVPIPDAAIGARAWSVKARKAVKGGDCRAEDLIWDPARNRMVCPWELVVAASGISSCWTTATGDRCCLLADGRVHCLSSTAVGPGSTPD